MRHIISQSPPAHPHPYPHPRSSNLQPEPQNSKPSKLKLNPQASHRRAPLQSRSKAAPPFTSNLLDSSLSPFTHAHDSTPASKIMKTIQKKNQGGGHGLLARNQHRNPAGWIGICIGLISPYNPRKDVDLPALLLLFCEILGGVDGNRVS